MTKTDKNDKFLYFAKQQIHTKAFDWNICRTILSCKQICMSVCAQKNIQTSLVAPTVFTNVSFFPVGMINQFIFLPIYRKLIQAFFLHPSISLSHSPFFLMLLKNLKDINNNSTQKILTHYRHFKFVLSSCSRTCTQT